MSKQVSSRRASFRVEVENHASSNEPEAEVFSLLKPCDEPMPPQASPQTAQECDKKLSVKSINSPNNNQSDNENGKQTPRTTPVKSSTSRRNTRIESPVTMTKLIHENSMLKQKLAHVSGEHESQLQAQLQQVRLTHEQIESKMKKQMALLEKRQNDALASTKKAQAQVEELTRKLREYETREQQTSTAPKTYAVVAPASPQRRGNGSPIPYGHHMSNKHPPTWRSDTGRARIVHGNVTPPPVTSSDVPTSNQYRLTTSPERAAQVSAAYAHPAATYSTTTHPPPSPMSAPCVGTPSQASPLLEKKPSSGGILSHYTGVITRGAVMPDASAASMSTKVMPQWMHHGTSQEQQEQSFPSQYDMSIPVSYSSSPSSSTESTSPTLSSMTSRLFNAASSKFISYYAATPSTAPIEANSPC